MNKTGLYTRSTMKIVLSPRGFLSRRVRFAFSVSAALALFGCASAPDKPAPAPVPPPAPTFAPAAAAPAPVCAPCPVCAVCPSLATPPVVSVPFTPPPAGPDPTRGRLERTTWQALPAWGSDDAGEALNAFVQSCTVLNARPEWQAACTRAQNLPSPARGAVVTRFFEENFEPFQVINADESNTGIVTGYYEPLLRGSRTRTDVYRYPLYAPPQDLITVDLGELYPDLKNRRLRGRLVGNKVVPYLDRGEIESDTPPLKGLEIAWVEDPIEAFFLQIQGSGQIQLPDGSRLRVGYADQNGHPFRSLGGALIRRGEIRPESASMQGIKAWAQRNPRKVQQFMNANPSFVFFKELPGDLTGPIGTLGVPLTAERSIAVDQRVIPLGVPVYLSSTMPNSNQPLNRLMVAQDTGGAIAGAVRADFYWGFGDGAGSQAGRMKQQGRMWVLLPRGYDPNTTPRAPASPGAIGGAKK
jgi:membrane-bound lytic murein transglycosylase A